MRWPAVLWILPFVSACAAGPQQDARIAPTTTTTPIAEPSSTTSNASMMSPVAMASVAATVSVEPPLPAAPRYGVMYSTRRISWVYLQPNTESRKLGYLSVGVPVSLREPGKRPASTKCLGGYFAVEPTGFVCAGSDTTTDPNHPLVVAMQEAGRSSDRAYPFHYGLSLGAPMYNKLPDRKTHDAVMMRYANPGKRLGDWARSFLDMDTNEPIVADSELPSFLRDGRVSPNSTQGYVRRSIPHSSLLSYSIAFEYDGRVWVLAEDLSVVPADRIVPFRRTAFRGVELGGAQRLPIAWACLAERRKLRQTEEGVMERTGESWTPREMIPLTGRATMVRHARYVESADGNWIAASDVCEAKPVDKLPDGIGADDRWLYLSMMEDTVVAYQGREAVFATLHSPGRGGSHRGKGDVRQYTTPLGSFFINWKERWATLSPDSGAATSFWISDVPGVQYFQQPYALHGAYWHERFGTPMSAGCPNLAPVDAIRLMDFTEPALPDGWQAIGPARGQRGTMVVVGP